MPNQTSGRVAGISACQANGGRIEPQHTAPGRVASSPAVCGKILKGIILFFRWGCPPCAGGRGKTANVLAR